MHYSSAITNHLLRLGRFQGENNLIYQRICQPICQFICNCMHNLTKPLQIKMSVLLKASFKNIHYSFLKCVGGKMKHQISSNSIFKTVPLHNKEIKMALTIWQVTLTEERSRTDYRNVPIYVTISHLKRRSLSTLESPQHLTIFLPMGVRYFHVITTLQS